jgi:hypothetical protein
VRQRSARRGALAASRPMTIVAGTMMRMMRRAPKRRQRK